MSDTGMTARRVETALSDRTRLEEVEYNPSIQRLRELAADDETTTSFGAPAFVSEQRSRSADHTKNAIDHQFTEADCDYVQTAVDAVDDRPMLCLDRRVGRHPECSFVCRYWVPPEHARIALAWANLFEPAEADGEPDFTTVQLPDHDELAIRILPDEGITAVLGSDYTGEAKKSFLRLFMRRVKEAGGLGLHAGSKRVQIDTGEGVETVGQLFLGLSGTGKSTLTAHGLALDGEEHASMLQDDVCGLLSDGTVAGSEGNGLYVKTFGLDGDEQPAMYDAVTDESAVLENVVVDDDGTVDFDDDRHTRNGRAVISRDRLDSADEDIDLAAVDQVFFITRNPLMPPIAKLSAEQAAAAFMLGESVQTSAGDPSKAGESIRVVGTNPFIMGPKGEEGNRFRELIDTLDVDCYLLNTGSVGDADVGVEDTVTILREAARGRVEWNSDGPSTLSTPDAVPGLDVDRFDLAANIENARERLDELRSERREYFAEFDTLDQGIVDAAY